MRLCALSAHSVCRHRFPDAQSQAAARAAQAHKDVFHQKPAWLRNGADAIPSGSLLLPDAQVGDPVAKVHQQHMLNCVRFGRVAGRERAVVAGQNGVVYVFELPEGVTPETRVPVRRLPPLLACSQRMALT